MLPRPFRYHRPETLTAALAALDACDDAAPYAGGTELLLVLKMRLADHADLVDLKRIPDLKHIDAGGDALAIGAMATHAAIARHGDIARLAPALAMLCGSIANPRVRSVGTIGGNLCFAEPTADPPTLLAAYGATLHLASASGTRSLPAADFIVGPLETARAANEVLVRIDIPVGRATTRYVRHAHGHRALAGAGAFVPAGAGEAARVWLGGVAERPTPLTAAGAAIAAASGPLDLARIAAAARQDIAGLDILDDAEAGADYRRHIAGVVAGRAIAAAAEAAGRKVYP